MGTSTLILFKNSKILATENFVVDDINDYLAQLDSTRISNFQRVKHALNIVIKIDINQEEWSFDKESFNYCTIQNGTEKRCYYFIMNKIWSSENTATLVLKMDVLNTFRLDNDFTLSPRTMVLREHKDRFKKQSITKTYENYEIPKGEWLPAVPPETGFRYVKDYQFPELIGISNPEITITGIVGTYISDFDSTTGTITVRGTLAGSLSIRTTIKITFTYSVIHRVIDLYSEGITTKLYKKETYALTDNNLNFDWYLIYKNSEDDEESTTNVVNCFIATQNAVTWKDAFDSYILDNAQFQGHRSASFSDSAGNITFYDNTLQKWRTIPLSDLVIYTGGIRSIYLWKTNEVSFSLNNGSIIYARRELYFSNQHTITADGSSWQLRQITQGTHNAIGFNDINKTSSKIIKIIKLPYAPSDGFESDGNTYYYDKSKFEYDNNEQLLKLKDLSLEFFHNIYDDTKAIAPLERIDITPQKRADKSKNYESKLFHSEFYYWSYFYDSFSKPIRLEQVYPYAILFNNSPVFNIRFKPSRTINSRFLFQWDLAYQYADEEFPNTFTIERNNDEVIYNSPYINYIRSGFNYDVKSKNRQETFSWLGAGLGIAGGIISLVAGEKTTGALLVASSIASLSSAINSTITAEQNLQAKQEQLKWQTNSVNNTDAVDLMSYYCDNRVKKSLYSVSPKMEKALFDLFYYTGYVGNEMKIPATNTRIWRNFVQAELVFASVPNIPEELLDELMQRYRGGATFLHNNSLIIRSITIKEWDFEGLYENFETWFFN